LVVYPIEGSHHMTTATANRPKFNRCDWCGRNAHKVAVRKPDGRVLGFCPSCYASDGPVSTHYGPDSDAVVIYDRRARGRS
jgi:hypothetical protein